MRGDANDRDSEWRGFMRPVNEAVPPAPDRVKATLEARGLLGGSRRVSRPRGGRRVLLAVAAAVLVFVLGYGAGRASIRESAAAVDRYALFVLGDGTDDVPEARKVAEYGEWLTSLRVAGIEVNGEKLSNPGWTLDAGAARFEPGADPVPADRVTGFFIVTAPSPDSALALARGMPHLRHGGRLVLRAIEPT